MPRLSRRSWTTRRGAFRIPRMMSGPTSEQSVHSHAKQMTLLPIRRHCCVRKDNPITLRGRENITVRPSDACCFIECLMKHFHWRHQTRPTARDFGEEVRQGFCCRSRMFDGAWSGGMQQRVTCSVSALSIRVCTLVRRETHRQIALSPHLSRRLEHCTVVLQLLLDFSVSLSLSDWPSSVHLDAESATYQKDSRGGTKMCNGWSAHRHLKR